MISSPTSGTVLTLWLEFSDGNHYRSYGVGHPRHIRGGSANRPESLSHSRAPRLRPISGHIGHWAGDLCPTTTTGRRADDLCRPGCWCRRAGRLTPAGTATGGRHRRLGGEVARDGAQWSRPLRRYRLNPPRAQRLRAVRLARGNGPSMPASNDCAIRRVKPGDSGSMVITGRCGPSCGWCRHPPTAPARRRRSAGPGQPRLPV